MLVEWATEECVKRMAKRNQRVDVTMCLLVLMPLVASGGASRASPETASPTHVRNCVSLSWCRIRSRTTETATLPTLDTNNSVTR
jgi:hypothetical protein